MPNTGSMANTIIHIKNKTNKYIFRDQGMRRAMADSAGFIDKTGHGRCGVLQTPTSVPMWWPQSISQKESCLPTPQARTVKMHCPHISTDDGDFPAKPQMLIGSVFLILCVRDSTEYLDTPASSSLPSKISQSFIHNFAPQPGLGRSKLRPSGKTISAFQ